MKNEIGGQRERETETEGPQKLSKKLATNLNIYIWRTKFKVEDMAIAIVLLFKKLDALRYARRIQIHKLQLFFFFLVCARSLSPAHGEMGGMENSAKKTSRIAIEDEPRKCRLGCQFAHEMKENSIKFVAVLPTILCWLCHS